MRKKLIVVLIVLAILLAGAIGAVVFLESRSSDDPVNETETGAPAVETTAAPETDAAEETTEPTEETVGISLPTENPEDVLPAETFSDEDYVPGATLDPDATYATEDRDANELPEDEF